MRILVIEDERDLLESICLTLREEGYAVDSARNGELGLYHATNYDYDAVILDINLPKIDGFTLLERMRQRKATPVLVLTARDQIRDRVRGLDSGADDYLVKPFDFEELSARLRAVIRRHAKQGRNIIEIGDIMLDTGLRVVSKSGEAVEFTPREYRLLEFLALHRGNVISRTQLYEHLSDDGDDTASNVLDVHVFNIRKKLGAGLITTRRGHGYCIE
jgi:two-component system OmpR family response regulator